MFARLPWNRCLVAFVVGAAPAIACTFGLAAEHGSEREQARRILDATGVRGGLVVHLGCRDGRLTAALRINESFIVHGLDTDRAPFSRQYVEKARSHVRSRGLYGPVSIERLDGRVLPYVDELVNLVVSEDLGEVTFDEVRRVLAPGGVAYIRHGDAWRKTVKPWPEDIDEWTHWLHGADNNGVAMDTRVGPPRHLKWKADPMWCRSHNGVPSSVALVLSAGGRLFSLIDEGLIGQPGLPERWTLVARDAFNGKLLWKKPFAKPSKRSLVADTLPGQYDRLHLISADRELSVLDAATGRTLRTCPKTRGSDELVCAEGVVVVHVGGARSKAGALLGINADNGQLVWETPVKSFVRDSLAAADGQAYYHTGSEIVCLDLHRGKEKWRAPCKAGRGGTIMIYGGVVFSTAGGLQALAADTGELLWKGPRVQRRLGVFGAAGLIWLTDVQEQGRTFLWTPAAVVARGYDPKTGEVKRTITVPRLVTPGHHIRCYPAKATARYLLLPKRGVEFVDLSGENHMRNDWLRAPCGHGVMPANGLLYVPPHPCFCYPGVRLDGFNAVSADTGKQPPPTPAAERLHRGPAYTAIQNLKSETSNLKSETSNLKSEI